MTDTIYSAPTELAEAVRQLAQPGAAALSGGTDLLVQLRGGRAAPSAVVDLKHIAGLRQIEIGNESIRIGAAVTGIQITDHPQLGGLVPGFVDGVGLIGSTQVQGRATPVGNLCNGSPAADSVPAMIAAGAVCEISGPSGDRQLPVAEMVTGPGKTALQPGEIVTALVLPKPAAGQADAYLRFIPRTEMDIAVAGAAVNLTLDAQGVVTHARVVIGAVGPTAILVTDAANELIGTRLDAAALDGAAAAASAAARPIDDKRGTAEFRRKVVGVLARRAAVIAGQRATERLNGSKG